VRVPIFLCVLLSAAGATAQTTDDQLTFEVASVKPTTSTGTGSSIKGGPGTNDPGRIVATNRPLRVLIQEAYGVRNFQIENPAWMSEARYDVVAKVPSGATPQQAKVMMRNLLKDRFHVEIRREDRTVTTYMLTVAKNGPKLKPAAEVPAETEDHPVVGIFQHYADGKVTAQARKQNIAKLLTWLTTLLGEPVLDETKLKGEYDWSLSWSPEDGNTSIFPAIQQQLGLKLEGRKAPVNMLIVLSALKIPTEN
jgi:uncharacterized protein (TIGR03435 family)